MCVCIDRVWEMLRESQVWQMLFPCRLVQFASVSAVFVFVLVYPLGIIFFVGVVFGLCRSGALRCLVRFFEERAARWSEGYEIRRRLRTRARFEVRVLSLVRILFKKGKLYYFLKTSF